MKKVKLKRNSSRFDPSNYEKIAYRNLGGSLVSERELSDIVRFSEVGPGSFILDVGMGPGRVLRRLASINTTLVGIDADAKMVRHFAHQRRTGTAALDIDNAHVIVASGDYLPFREDVFGAIVCVRVLRYFDEPAKAISEMSRTLRLKGRLVLELANVFRPQSILQLPGYAVRGSVYPRLFTRRAAFKWLSENGIFLEGLHGWHRIPVEVMNAVNGPILARTLNCLDQLLDRILPPEFMSRSLVISGVKISDRLNESSAIRHASSTA